MRNDTSCFPEKITEHRAGPPARKFQEDLKYHNAYDNAINQSQKKSIATATGCRGQYIFATTLPNFNRVTDVAPDAMHTIAVCMKHILSLITGKESDDSVCVRNAEKAFNRFPECWAESKVHTDNNLQSGKSMEEGRSHGKRGTKRKHSDSTKGKKSESSSSTRQKLPLHHFN